MANEEEYRYVDVEMYAYLKISTKRIQEVGFEQAAQEALDKFDMHIPGEVRVPETYENDSLFEELDEDLPENMYTNTDVLKIVTTKSSNTDAKSLLDLLDMD